MNSTNKKRFIIPLFILLTVILFSLFLLQRKSPFRNFCDNIFKEELSNDTLGLHYTLAHPDKFGIKTDTVSLPLYNKGNALTSYKKIQESLHSLKSFDSTALSNEEARTYNLLSKALSHELTGQQYFYLQEVFSPSGGTQLQYPILMAEYPFRCKKDVTDYLELLKITPSYFESLCQFETEKVRRGFGMPDYSLNKVINQCNSIMDSDALKSGDHFLITTFNERITQILSQKHITKKEAEEYLLLNKQYLSTYVLPAYRSLSDTLSGFMGQGKNQNGLSFFTEGKNYYEWLFKTSTGSNVSVKDAYRILSKDYYNTLLTLDKKLEEFQNKSTLSGTEISFFPTNDYDEILADLQTRMSSDFPTITSSFNAPSLPASVKEVSSALEEYSAPAYYMLPPIDDNSTNSIYVNHSSVPKGLDLYTTLAHEGYPGHLYQTTYYQTYCKKNDVPHLRNILNYMGYVEGWALYTEFLSFDYAADLLVDKTGNEDYRLLCEIYQLERKASLSMLTLLDIGIHYYGLDYERTKELLNAHGIYNDDSIREIFEYIAEEPANYAKYYWGYTEIMNLKESAKKQMNEYYTDYAFHSFFLECGPSDFETLHAELTKKK